MFADFFATFVRSFTCGIDEYGHVSGWCQRSRPEFTFDYASLEEEVVLS